MVAPANRRVLKVQTNLPNIREESATGQTFRGRTRPNVPASSKFKTELCHYLRELSTCPFAESCTYAHSENELRLIDRHPKHRTQLCRDFSNQGYCPFGERCSFIHEKPDPAKIYTKLMSCYNVLLKRFPSKGCVDQENLTAPMTTSLVDDGKCIGYSQGDFNSLYQLRPPTASSGYASPCSLITSPNCNTEQLNIGSQNVSTSPTGRGQTFVRRTISLPTQVDEMNCSYGTY